MGCRLKRIFPAKWKPVCRKKNAHFIFASLRVFWSQNRCPLLRNTRRGEGSGQPEPARQTASNRWEPDPATAAAQANEGCTGLFSHGFRPRCLREGSNKATPCNNGGGTQVPSERKWALRDCLGLGSTKGDPECPARIRTRASRTRTRVKSPASSRVAARSPD